MCKPDINLQTMKYASLAGTCLISLKNLYNIKDMLGRYKTYCFIKLIN